MRQCLRIPSLTISAGDPFLSPFSRHLPGPGRSCRRIPAFLLPVFLGFQCERCLSLRDEGQTNDVHRRDRPRLACIVFTALPRLGAVPERSAGKGRSFRGQCDVRHLLSYFSPGNPSGLAFPGGLQFTLHCRNRAPAVPVRLAAHAVSLGPQCIRCLESGPGRHQEGAAPRAAQGSKQPSSRVRMGTRCLSGDQENAHACTCPDHPDHYDPPVLFPLELLSRRPYECPELVLEAGNDAHPRAYPRNHHGVAGEIDLSGRAKGKTGSWL